MTHNPSKPKHSICWSCNKACGKCSWSKNFTPVPGWQAKKTIIKNCDVFCGELMVKYTDSFLVINCPLFEGDTKVPDYIRIAKERNCSTRTAFRILAKQNRLKEQIWKNTFIN